MRCEPAHHFTVAKARAWRSSIDDSPAYQRGGDAWSLGQRQRFIDSLLNGYDVPKLYLHDLRGQHPTKVYAVVDGKQRLHAIWSFLADGFGLAEDFVVGGPPPATLRRPAAAPTPSSRFSELDPQWQELLLGTFLSVVLIREADEADIDDLFARLNDGTPLTAAERRNALGGSVATLIRDVAARPALRALLPFAAAHGSHLEVAGALVAAEMSWRRDPRSMPDLRPTALDAMVRDGRRLGDPERGAVSDAIDRQLSVLTRSVGASETRLATPGLAVERLTSIIAGLPDDLRSDRRTRPVTVQAVADQRSKRTG